MAQSARRRLAFSRAQRARHPPLSAPALLGQQLLERIEVARHVRRKRGAEAVEVEQVDVEVARGARDRLQPAKAVAEVLERLPLEHALQLTLQRARASHGHAQVVEELAVGVGERAGQVGLDRQHELAEHLNGGGVGALVGPQRDVEPPGHAARHAAGHGNRLVVKRRGREGQPHVGLERLAHPLRGLLVAAHGHDVNARAQLLVRAGRPLRR